MRAWLHKQISKVENWRDNKRANNKPLYYSIWIVFWVAVCFLKKILDFLFSEFSSDFQWGWIVKILIIIAVVCVYGLIFYLDKIKARKNKITMYLEPWMLIVFLTVLFFIHYSKVAPIPETNPIQESLYTDPPSGTAGQTDNIACQSFLTGDYAYSVLFFEKAQHDYPNGSWQGGKPL